MARSFVAASSQKLERSGAVASAYPLTLAGWFIVTDFDALGDDVGVLCVGTVGGGEVLLRIGAAGDARIKASVNNVGFGTASASGAASSGVWTHGCAVFENSTSRSAYRDGGNKATNATAKNFPAVDTTTIGYTNSFGTYFGGKIAEVAVWDVALTDDEVLTLAKGVSPLAVRSASLVAYWPLWGNYSPEIDLVGGANLTVTGATQAAHVGVVMPRGRRQPISVTEASSTPQGEPALVLRSYARKPASIGGRRGGCM